MGTGAPLFVFWQFTPLQVENLLRRAGLRDNDFDVELYGNLFARIAYQMNMPAEELTAGARTTSTPGIRSSSASASSSRPSWTVEPTVPTPGYRTPARSLDPEVGSLCNADGRLQAAAPAVGSFGMGQRARGLPRSARSVAR